MKSIAFSLISNKNLSTYIILFSTFMSRQSCLLSNSDEKWSDYLFKTLATTLATYVLREHISFGSLSAPRKTSNISQEFFILLLKRALIILKTSWKTSPEFGITKCLFCESGSCCLGHLEILLNRIYMEYIIYSSTWRSCSTEPPDTCDVSLVNEIWSNIIK